MSLRIPPASGSFKVLMLFSQISIWLKPSLPLDLLSVREAFPGNPIQPCSPPPALQIISYSPSLFPIPLTTSNTLYILPIFLGYCLSSSLSSTRTDIFVCYLCHHCTKSLPWLRGGFNIYLLTDWMKEQINEFNIWISIHLTPCYYPKTDKKDRRITSCLLSTPALAGVSLDCHFPESRHYVWLCTLISVLTTVPDT